MESFNSINVIVPIDGNNNNPLLRFIIHNINTNTNTIDDIMNESFNEEMNVKNPTSKEFIKNLEEFEIIQEDIDNNLSCAICQEQFKLGDSVIGIPCKPHMHYFHNGEGECEGIKPWLNQNNTCPICRCEFPIEEPINQEEPIEQEQIINNMNINNIINQPIINIPITPEQIIDNQEEIINNMDIPQFPLFTEIFENNLQNFINDVNIQINDVNTHINDINTNMNLDIDDIGFSINEIDEAIRRSLNN